MRRTAALIAGGGPAGAAAAIRLAGGGMRALVVERHRTPHDALCGGFLSWRTLATLRALGVDPAELRGQRVERVRLFAGNASREADLPGAAMGISRRVLDAALLRHAEQAGAGVERGVAIRQAEGTAIRTGDGATLTADMLVLATGKQDLRGLARAAPAEADPTLGLRFRLPPGERLRRVVGDAIELHLFDRGYAGLVLHEDGSANLCMAVRRSRLREAGDAATLLRVVAGEVPPLADRLTDVQLPPPDAVANVPYGWRTARTEPNVFRVGDQAGVIPSLAGEGMGIALASGFAAADAVLTGIPAPRYQRAMNRRLRRPLTLAGFAWRLAEHPAGARLLTACAVPGAVDLVARLTRIAPSVTGGSFPPR